MKADAAPRRIIIAGTGSGCGKTTVSLALMRSLADRGQVVQPFKVGPDYIDPGFHRAACGRISHNLDAHLMAEADIRMLLHWAMRGADVGVIEGVMGYFDGMGSGLHCSTCDMARIIEAPVLLVIDASGGATSCAAVALGFRQMVEPSRIAGVIANRVSSERHFELVRDAVREHVGIPCVGWMGKDDALHLQSRHLGLVPAGENRDLDAKIERAARNLHIDWAALDALADGAMDIPAGTWPVAEGLSGLRIGIALDEVFHFYYEANLELLRRSGAELVPFSPLRDARLPGKLDALYIGGGYPEVFAAGLMDNASMRQSIRAALDGGLRCYAECGGLMYLTRAIDGCEMVGFLDAECRMTERLQRFGYCEVTCGDMRFPAHEFHHSELIEGNIKSAFTARKRDVQWVCGYQKGNTLAQYPHAHFLSRPELATRLFGGRT